MADLFSYAVAYLLSNETYEGPNGIVSLYENPKTGEISQWGISLAFLQRIQPGATADDIRALTEQQAVNLYRCWFWDESNLGVIQDPLIAARCLDLSTNMGTPWGVRMLQAALNLTTDGILGPQTQAACNAANPAILYAAIVRAATTRYQALHDAQVGQYGQSVADKNLQQWIIRLHKMPPPYTSQP